MGLVGLGCGIGMSMASSAAITAITEKPEIFGKTVIYVVLIEAIAIYGLITSIILSGYARSNELIGLGVGLVMGLIALGCGYGMSMASSAAIAAITEKPEIFGKTVIYVVLIEAIAIYGLITSIILAGYAYGGV